MNPRTLPDHILSNLLCRQCYLYLSVGPVTNSESKPVCGRCNTNTKKGTTSLWNILSAGFKFKCSNHLNGCEEILTPSQMAVHEATCEYGMEISDNCPFCKFLGNMLQMSFHLRKDHSASELRNGIFSVSLTKEKVKNIWLHDVRSQNIFLVTFELNVIQFCVSVQYLIRRQALSKPKLNLNSYLLKLFNLEESWNANYITNNCGINEIAKFEISRKQLIDSFGVGATFSFQVVVGEIPLEIQDQEVLGRYQQLLQKEKLLNISQKVAKRRETKLQEKAEMCDNISELIKLMCIVVLKCNNCLKVCPAAMSYCPKLHCYCRNCLTNVCKVCGYAVKYTRLPYIENITFICEYPECKRMIKLMDYAQHRNLCDERRYQCPLQGCNGVMISAQKLFEHWHSTTALYRSQKSEECITFNNYRKEEFYWLVQGDLYHVLMDFQANNIEVLISERIVVSNNNKLKCEGYVASPVNGHHWLPLSQSDFCGKFRIKMVNGHSYSTSQKHTKIKFVFE